MLRRCPYLRMSKCKYLPRAPTQPLDLPPTCRAAPGTAAACTPGAGHHTGCSTTGRVALAAASKGAPSAPNLPPVAACTAHHGGPTDACSTKGWPGAAQQHVVSARVGQIATLISSSFQRSAASNEAMQQRQSKASTPCSRDTHSTGHAAPRSTPPLCATPAHSPAPQALHPAPPQTAARRYFSSCSQQGQQSLRQASSSSSSSRPTAPAPAPRREAADSPAQKPSQAPADSPPTKPSQAPPPQEGPLQPTLSPPPPRLRCPGHPPGRLWPTTPGPPPARTEQQQQQQQQQQCLQGQAPMDEEWRPQQQRQQGHTAVLSAAARTSSWARWPGKQQLQLDSPTPAWGTHPPSTMLTAAAPPPPQCGAALASLTTHLATCRPPPQLQHLHGQRNRTSSSSRSGSSNSSSVSNASMMAATAAVASAAQQHQQQGHTAGPLAP
jgi:hypothetical protein